MEDLEKLWIFGVLLKFCNSSWKLLCRVKKFPSLKLQHLLLRETTLLLVRIVILFRKLSVIYLVWTLLKNLLVSPVSLTHFQFLPVVQDSKGSFWIFDNQFTYRQKFKLKDLGVATQLFDCYYYLFKFDFKSGYHHIDIFPGHRKFLTFVWDFGNWISNIFSVLCDPFRALFSSAYFYINLEAITEIVEGPGHS